MAQVRMPPTGWSPRTPNEKLGVVQDCRSDFHFAAHMPSGDGPIIADVRKFLNRTLVDVATGQLVVVVIGEF